RRSTPKAARCRPANARATKIDAARSDARVDPQRHGHVRPGATKIDAARSDARVDPQRHGRVRPGATKIDAARSDARVDPNATAAYVLARRRLTRRAQTRSGRSACGHQPTARPRSSRVSSADHPSVPIVAENPFT